MIANHELGDETMLFIGDVHRAWRTSAPISSFAQMRDKVLANRGKVDTQIATLSNVTRIAYENLSCNDSHAGLDWDEFFALADSIESQHKNDGVSGLEERRRRYNQTSWERNLALVAALWSPDIVYHHNWNQSGQRQMQLIRACALRYPRFEADLCPRLNAVLLHRHCIAIQEGRGKTLIEAPLQPFRDLDLSTLAEARADPDCQSLWTTDDSGAVPLDGKGILLKELRPHHFHLYLLRFDRFGMLTPREHYAATPSLEGEMAFDWTSASTPSQIVYTHDLSEPVSFGNNATSEATVLLPFSTEPTTISPLLLQKHPEPMSEFDVASTPSSMATSLSHPSLSPTGSRTSNSDIQRRLDSPAASEVSSGTDTTSGFEGYSCAQRQVARIGTWPQSRCRNTSPNQSSPSSSTPNCHKARRKSKRAALRTAASSIPAASEQQQERSLQRTSNRVHDAPTPLPPVGHASTLEEELYFRYQGEIIAYAQMLAEQPATDRQSRQGQSRKTWLNTTTRCAKLWTCKDIGMLHGSASSEANAEVLYYSSRTFVMEAQEGKVFRKPVVIKETFADAGMHTISETLSMMQDIYDGTGYNIVAFPHGQQSLLMEQEKPDRDQPCQNSKAGVELHIPRNITKSHKPLFTMLRRFQLLGSLVERICGSISERNGIRTIDIINAIGYNLVGEDGACSRPQVNALGGVWVRNLHGLKLFTMVQQQDMNSEWQDFMAASDDWDPKGKERLIILEEGDVLLLPPGSSVPYVTHSPGESLLEGGVFWDDLDILETLRNLRRNSEMNEGMAATLHQLIPQIIAELDTLVMSQPHRFCGNKRFHDFKLDFEQASIPLKTRSCR